jgi:dTDP-D-glucose 4,6-dehydratase
MQEDIPVKTFLITGGAGFIGSALIRHIINDTNYKVVNIDKLTYAGNLESLESIEGNERYVFERADICNNIEIRRIFNQHQPEIVPLQGLANLSKLILWVPISFLSNRESTIQI